MPSRQLIVHSAFTAVFVAIAVFAVWTANGTTAPWFSAAISSQAYAASLVGAVVVAIALAAAAAMLPGSDGFAASQYQLNTALLLFLGYGWMFLVFWAVMALSMLTARALRETPGPVRAGT